MPRSNIRREKDESLCSREHKNGEGPGCGSTHSWRPWRAALLVTTFGSVTSRTPLLSVPTYQFGQSLSSNHGFRLSSEPTIAS